MNKCETCRRWKNKQRELDFSEEYGICTGLFECDIEDGIKIVPHEELLLGIDYKFKNDNMSIKGNEYEFCTYKTFGCIWWEKK